MEHFVVSARKYRPKTFKDVVGQQAITNTLLNAIDNDHLAQALLFTGPRGVGKTTCARILAKKINSDGTEHPDEDFAFNIFELDAASNNSVDDIRSLIDQVRIPPQVGNYKVYIIDEVHMLSAAAFNAFLKTLEEPPKHAIFILATTEKHKIIPTILSRCQIFDFKRISVIDAKNYLSYIAELQGIDAEDDALHIIAQKADGAMRDALSIFDRVVSFSGKNLTRQAVTENLNVLDYETYFEATDLILKNDIPKLLVHFNNTLTKGFDGHHFVSGLASHFRDLLVCKNKSTIALLEVGEKTREKYLAQSSKTSQAFLIKGIELSNETDLKYKTSKNQRLLVELCLMQLASITYDGEKKNDRNFIIPPSFFRKNTSNLQAKRSEAVKDAIKHQAQLASPATEAPTTEDSEASPEDKHTVVKPSSPPEQINTKIEAENTPPKIKVANTFVSGLSISSIKQKVAHEKKLNAKVVDETNLPSDPFTEEKMQEYWEAYIQKLNKAGRKNLASIVGISIPKILNETTLVVQFPNQIMKVELERAKNPLLKYLKGHLNNYDIQLQINVNEEDEKKYAYLPKDIYEKLKTMNPAIEKLRKTFDLDF
jgi:DNA polymerase-3 subunit gamma/tau